MQFNNNLLSKNKALFYHILKGITKIYLRNKAFLDFKMKIRIRAYIIVAREALRKILKKFKFRKKSPCFS